MLFQRTAIFFIFSNVYPGYIFYAHMFRDFYVVEKRVFQNNYFFIYDNNIYKYNVTVLFNVEDFLKNKTGICI